MNITIKNNDVKKALYDFFRPQTPSVSAPHIRVNNDKVKVRKP